MADTPSRRRTRGAPADLGAILAEVAQRSGEIRLRQASVGAAIADAVGPFLARRLTGVWVDGERCRLETPDAAAADELARHVPMLLARLQRRLGSLAPTSLSIRRVGNRAGSWRGHAKEASAAPIAAPERPLAERALSSVEDPEARARLARWLERTP